MDQKDIFAGVEGDNYYARNKSSLTSIDEMVSNDQILISLKALGIQPQSILEIGCSNGWRLEALRRIFNAECVGIDPSPVAISDGKASFPDIALQKGTADSLPYEDKTFDVVIFGFCLYLCDRHDLFKIAYEADRVLKDAGHIVLLDFHPPFPYRKKYKHQEGVFSYKMNYANLFLWNPGYILVAQTTFTHHGLTDIEDPDERLSVAVLLKNNRYAYPDDPFLGKNSLLSSIGKD